MIASRSRSGLKVMGMKNKKKAVEWEGRLIPKSVIIDTFFKTEKKSIKDAENVIADTESQLSDQIESADEESSLASVAENGKVKAKDIEAKIFELTQHVETEETRELVKLLGLLPTMRKKDFQPYVVRHPLCKSVINEKVNVKKSAIVDRLTVIRTIESVPESLKEDVNQLREALELCSKISEYNKIDKELYQALDKKCRAKYGTLTDDEIVDLLVNKKWFGSIFAGICDLNADISHRLTNRIIELAARYENTLPELNSETAEYDTKVKSLLGKMGFQW